MVREATVRKAMVREATVRVATVREATVRMASRVVSKDVKGNAIVLSNLRRGRKKALKRPKGSIL